jgi:predicted AAA+ superfamily ATPase
MLDAYLLFEVTYFSYSAKVKHDVSKLSKLYCLDNGLVNVVNIKYSKNLGQMLENTVFIKLAEKYREISYWGERDSEVDFIVEKTAINATATDQIPEREFKGLEDFNKKHKGFASLIVSKSLKKENIISLADFLKQE